jgi:hypothetical protein
MIDILYVGLSTFTVVYLVKFTDGPFDIFYRFKKFIGLIIPLYDDGETSVVSYIEDDDPSGFVAQVVRCFWCFSTWISFVLSIAYILLVNKSVYVFPFLWLASIGISGFIHTLIETMEKYGESH